jgi:hypothetical protein
MSKQNLLFLKEDSKFQIEITSPMYYSFKVFLNKLIQQEEDFPGTIDKLLELEELNDSQATIALLVYLVSSIEEYAEANGLVETKEVDLTNPS